MNPILEQYTLDGMPVKSVSMNMKFDDGMKIQLKVSGKYARRIIRALTSPDDDSLWRDEKEDPIFKSYMEHRAEDDHGQITEEVVKCLR